MPPHIIISRDEPIACPKCSHSYAISEGLSRQTIDRHAEAFEEALARRAREHEARIAAEAEARIDGFRAAELELRRQLREAEHERRNREVEYERRIDDERKRIEERTHAALAEEFQRREAQMNARLESAQREAADLKRKLEQGSQQTQGEAFELTLETMLRAAFPFDEIVPVPKGVNGADLLQRVRAPSGQVCGTIVWECKETRNWQPAWMGKLKDDQHALGAELAVLVTAAMPKDSREPFTRESDVWITRFDAARPLAEVLRTTLLELHKARQANIGRSEKMELLYNFVHSPQFAQRMQAVAQAFSTMRDDLEAEKNAMARIWKKREAQISRVAGGLMNVVGELQGLSEDGLPALEAVAVLPEPTLQSVG